MGDRDLDPKCVTSLRSLLHLLQSCPSLQKVPEKSFPVHLLSPGSPTRVLGPELPIKCEVPEIQGDEKCVTTPLYAFPVPCSHFFQERKNSHCSPGFLLLTLIAHCLPHFSHRDTNTCALGPFQVGLGGPHHHHCSPLPSDSPLRKQSRLSPSGPGEQRNNTALSALTQEWGEGPQSQDRNPQILSPQEPRSCM